MRFHRLAGSFLIVACCLASVIGAEKPRAGHSGAEKPRPSRPVGDAGHPRIVNIYNFVRNSDFRLTNSEEVLFEATEQQLLLLAKTGLPATWALQYDALINPRYQKLFKEHLGPRVEIGAWWELPRPLVEKAGLKWRGRFDWDSASNVGFSPGYTPEERQKLVDVYMAEFKSIFGYYPRTVGSWYIDEVTLAYMAERYGIVASCNCKDQVGTDGYTLWGGYWNQAYYPSRLNAYMPAQTKSGQIDVPVFRMLGSDPIYQHGTTPGLYSLEPVYRESGGSEKWVMWYMTNLIHQPSLAFAYTQAGQENSFGWNAMKTGFTQQVALYAKLVKEGKIQVRTLAQTGKWFKDNYKLTPPTTVAMLTDWKQEGRRTVWYDSRFYRLNLLWGKDSFFIRDFHCFDESVVSPTHATVLTNSSLAYDTLPIMDWAIWSGPESKTVGMRPVLLSDGGAMSPMLVDGPPILKGLDSKTLSIQQALRGGGSLTLICRETNITCVGTNAAGQPLRWAWQLVGGERQKTIVKAVHPDAIAYQYAGTDYQLQLPGDSGSCLQLANGDIQLTPNSAGTLVLAPERTISKADGAGKAAQATIPAP